MVTYTKTPRKFTGYTPSLGQFRYGHNYILPR